MARKPALVGTDRRRRILEAALDVFAEQGLEGATTKEIATRAGVTPGLIYFYFPGKEELFFAAFEHQACLAFGQLDLSEEATSDEPPERVMRRVVARFVRVMDSPRSASLMRILMRESVHCDAPSADSGGACAARDQIKQLSRRLSTDLRDYLAARMARGKLRALDPALVAQILTGAMVTVMLRRVSGDPTLSHLSHEELTETIVSVFLRGLLPDPPAHAPDLATAASTSG
jgi:AcrR family transcriptional regulator